jgi:hypothetical protein
LCAYGERCAARQNRQISGNLIVQLGLATEQFNRRWYERTTGQIIKDVQSWVRHPVIRWMAATLDGIVEGSRGRPRRPVLSVFSVADERRRTPGPPPFSLVNSIPAPCRAFRILSLVSVRPPNGPSLASNRLIVGMETLAAAANSSWDQAKSARRYAIEPANAEQKLHSVVYRVRGTAMRPNVRKYAGECSGHDDQRKQFDSTMECLSALGDMRSPCGDR